MRLRDAVLNLIARDLAGSQAPDELKRELRSLQRASDGELIGHLERVVEAAGHHAGAHSAYFAEQAPGLNNDG